MVKIAYLCNQCGRTVYVAQNGYYLPIHREIGKRRKCNGSETHVAAHKRV